MILDELYESAQTCPECGGPAFSNLILAEKKDACYNKVRSRYKVWPSAYASGALVQCRKKGASNWGNKSKNEDVAEGSDDHIWGPQGRFAGDTPVNIGGATIKKIQVGDVVTYFGEKAKVIELGATQARISANGKTWNVRKSDLKQLGQGVAEGSGQEPGEFEIYDLRTMKRVYHPFEANDIMDAFVKADDWLEAIGKSGRGLSVRPVRDQGVAEEQLDEKCWDTHRQAGMKKKGDRMVPNCVPKEGVEEGDKIGNMDANRFDDAMSRLKKLATQGPMKTVWDPVKRVYKNVPVAVQPKQQPSK